MEVRYCSDPNGHAPRDCTDRPRTIVCCGVGRTPADALAHHNLHA
jgi:hypothetical protein